MGLMILFSRFPCCFGKSNGTMVMNRLSELERVRCRVPCLAEGGPQRDSAGVATLRTLSWEDVLDSPSGPTVVPRVLATEREKGLRSEERRGEGSRHPSGALGR